MIAVLGATGRVGTLVAQGLAAAGADAFTVQRRHGADDPPLPARLADLRDPASVRTAFDGAERLFLLTPAIPDQGALERTAIGAAHDAGVRRIVKVSGGAATLGPNGTTATAIVHWASERAIERSCPEYAFLRPSFFAQNLLTTVAPTARATGLLPAPFGSAAIAMVDVRDLAASAVAALLDPEPARRAWRITGPRAVTFAEIADHVGLRAVPVPRTAAARALRRQGAGAFEIEHATQMAAYFAAGCDAAPTDAVRRLTGRDAHPVQQLLDEERAAFTPSSRPAAAVARLTRRLR